MIRNLIHNWPVLMFLGIVVTLMAVADANWPAHMGGASVGVMGTITPDGLMSLVGL